MKIARMILMAGLGLSLSACAAVDVPTRDAPFEPLPTSSVAAPQGYQMAPNAPTAAPQAIEVSKNAAALPEAGAAAPKLVAGQAPVSINSVLVVVPRDLKVSERNSYYPLGDIVWRGDPIGDRHAQVKAIFDTAMLRGVQPMQGPVKADLVIEVKRFHGLSEKARYTTGGMHAITFDLSLRDPATGQLLMPTRTVKADLEEFGGQQAILAEARGDTQKVRVTNHLAEVIRQELSNPEGYKNANLGFFQILNSI